MYLFQVRYYNSFRNQPTNTPLLIYDAISAWQENSDLAYTLFVPCLVSGCPSQDVVDNVDYEERNKDKGTNSCPHDFPVPVGTVAKHVLYVFFKPAMSKEHILWDITWYVYVTLLNCQDIM